jgi:predicted solute-binding protein
LTPLDYALHGGDYRIVPGVCAMSSVPTGTVRLFVKQGVRNIRTIAADNRVTSEIALAKIILHEKFPNLSDEEESHKVIPAPPDLGTMMMQADAALIVNVSKDLPAQLEHFSIDLVDEWYDLTGLPYPHGMWICHEGDVNAGQASRLLEAAREGARRGREISRECAETTGLKEEDIFRYLSSFSFEPDRLFEGALSEFFRYAFFYGIIGDVPDINFLETENAGLPGLSN